MQEALLEFEDLHVDFVQRTGTTHAVRGLSFAIAPGEVVALVGESGSGKSVSAMSAMRLLEEPPARYTGGRILWQGKNVLEMDAEQLLELRGNDIAIVFQEPMTSLNPTWTVGRQVAESLELHTDLDAAARRVRVVQLLHDVGLPDPESRYDQYPHELSGGQRQRVCIAMALACDPALLIADEPTTALDVTIQAQILELLRSLQADRGMAVLFITHDLGVVADLADRVVIMYQGQQVEAGAVTEVFANPQHPYTKGLLACRPRLSERRDRLPTVSDFMDAD
ncbi:MAG: ABC transporter ATP-binding protein [Planctomycetota bacterium]|jgi:peptide/nickel transport system ATP-binding protein|nr:ABC transporter ATP-binding protein [Planctomycetota bacterium]